MQQLQMISNMCFVDYDFMYDYYDYVILTELSGFVI